MIGLVSTRTTVSTISLKWLLYSSLRGSVTNDLCCNFSIID